MRMYFITYHTCVLTTTNYNNRTLLQCIVKSMVSPAEAMVNVALVLKAAFATQATSWASIAGERRPLNKLHLHCDEAK